MDFQELTLDFQSNEDETITVRGTSPGYRDAPTVHFHRPLQDWEIRALLAHGSGKDAGVEPPSLSEVGERLFKTVFRDGLRDHLLRLKGALEQGVTEGSPRGLRVRLRFSLNDQHRGYLSAVPWELLRDVDGGWMAADSDNSLVRDLIRSWAPRPRPLTVDGPVRVLVVAASPLGKDGKPTSSLLADEEVEKIRKAVDDDDRVVLQAARKPTLQAMRDHLRSEAVHVLHFIGHGGYVDDSGYGALIFEHEDRSRHEVDAENFADFLLGVPSLRLVVLSSCEGARYGGEPGAPFYGVAARLLERPNVPAVLAHQHAIWCDVAVELTGYFYRELAARRPVDAAINEARLRLSPTTHQWSTPVLFLSSPDGVLFGEGSGDGRPVAVGTDPAPAAVSTPADEPLPLHVGIRSFHGEDGVNYGTQMDEECDVLLDLRQHFDPDSHHGRLIRDPALWQEGIFPELRDFLGELARQNRDGQRPLLLDFAAHSTIAFATGYLLESKSGLDVQVRQRTGRTVVEWAQDEGAVPDVESLWADGEDVERPGAGPDLALAVSVSNPAVIDAVRTFVDRKALPVGRIRDASVAPAPGQNAVLSGRHAQRLAQTLVPWARVRRPEERDGQVHLFLSAPNAFTFYLGQLSRSFGSLALYEYSFGMETQTYQRSIELPPPGDREFRLPPGW